jgi:hypothetical protein
MENQFEVQRSLGRIEGGISDLNTQVSLLRTDHAGLRAEFNKLEAGRLTRLESAFATSEAVTHNKAKNTAMLFSSVIAIIISILTAIIIHYLKI